jgi:hypothetical protein
MSLPHQDKQSKEKQNTFIGISDQDARLDIVPLVTLVASGGMPVPGNYREFERLAFTFVCAAISATNKSMPGHEIQKAVEGASADLLKSVSAALSNASPEQRNRIGYLLSLAGLPDPWPPELSPPAALFGGDPILLRQARPEGSADRNEGGADRNKDCTDALARHWNLVRGADLSRLNQFLRVGLN